MSENNVQGLSESQLMNEMESFFDEGFTQFVQDVYEHPKDNDHWTGRVVNNLDPQMLGRVQIMIYGKYDDIPVLGLPWAVPDIKYLGSKSGNLIIPEIGTNVRGYFDHGDIHKPIYDSVAFDYQHQLSTATASQRKAGYPFNMVLLETDYGDYVTMNRTTGETNVQIHNGTVITISALGDISIKTGGKGNFKVESGGNTTIETKGNTTIKSDGNVTIDSKKKVNIGKSKQKQLVNNLTVCPFSGLLHYQGNTNVYV